jgi:hypothetical protein
MKKGKLITTVLMALMFVGTNAYAETATCSNYIAQVNNKIRRIYTSIDANIGAQVSLRNGCCVKSYARKLERSAANAQHLLNDIGDILDDYNAECTSLFGKPTPEADQMYRNIRRMERRLNEVKTLR